MIFKLQMILITLLLLAIAQILNAAKLCTTPDDQKGKCQPINQCEILYQRLTHRPLSTKEINDLQNFTCGFQGTMPKVCCPSQSSPVQSKVEILQADSFDLEIPSNDLLPNTDECGLYNPFRTYGRENPDLYEFPWMVLLHYNNTKGNKTGLMCGGVLISKRYVLTAANCIETAIQLGWTLTSVRLGEYNLDTDLDCVDYGFGEECAFPSINIESESTTIHENYTRRTGFQINDIALVRLKQTVKFTEFVQPICLPLTTQDRNKQYVGKKLFVAGWGRGGSKPKPKIKLKDLISVRPLSDCHSLVNLHLSENQLCASGEKGQQWCKGDIGGSLMAVGSDRIRKITRWYAIGVSSYGLLGTCGNEVYTKVSKYVPWILDNMKA